MSGADARVLQGHTCAIVGSSGGLRCWGSNSNGQVRGRFCGEWRRGERDVGWVGL